MTLLELLNSKKEQAPVPAEPGGVGGAIKGLASGGMAGGVPGAVAGVGLGLLKGILQSKAEEKKRQTDINVKESDDKLSAFRNNAANKSASIRQIISGL